VCVCVCVCVQILTPVICSQACLEDLEEALEDLVGAEVVEVLVQDSILNKHFNFPFSCLSTTNCINSTMFYLRI